MRFSQQCMSRFQTSCVCVCVCVMPCHLVDRYQYSQEPVAAIFSAGKATLKMKAPYSSKTLVPVYQTTWCNKQEGWNIIVLLMKRFGWSFWCRTVLMPVIFCSLQRTAGKRFATSFHPHTVYFDYNAVWKENIQRQFTFREPNGIVTETHVMIRLLDDVKHEMLAVEAINVNDKNWVFACVADVVRSEVRMW